VRHESDDVPAVGQAEFDSKSVSIIVGHQPSGFATARWTKLIQQNISSLGFVASFLCGLNLLEKISRLPDVSYEGELLGSIINHTPCDDK
jgi:hypothetical protein